MGVAPAGHHGKRRTSAVFKPSLAHGHEAAAEGHAVHHGDRQTAYAQLT